jgi:hypothetical protein
MDLFAAAGAFLGLYGTAQLVFGLVAEIVVVGTAVIFAVRLIYRKERRFINNVSSKFMLFSLATTAKLDTELRLIKESGIFNCPEKIETDVRVFDSMPDTPALFILSIEEQTNPEAFQEVYGKITHLKKPIIIYTNGQRNISWLNDPFLHAYSYYTIATSPLRLVSDIFTVLSTHANDS